MSGGSSEQSAFTLERHRIDNVTESMYYIPNFISNDEETAILQKIPPNKWVTLTHRRLQAVPTRLTANNTLLSSQMPVWLTNPVVDRIHNLGAFEGAPHGINHCLINEYMPGQGIMPHEDGSAYFPVVATVSLGGSTVLDVTSKRSPSDCVDTQPKRWRILQEPRSLLLTTGLAYSDTLHGIADVDEDTGLDAETVTNWMLLGDSQAFARRGGCNKRTSRISLTYRDVLKVSNVGSKIFGRSKA